MAKACKVPTSGSDSGKYSLAKTRPVTVLYRKKSYHSIVVPIVLAITARRNCTRCSISVSASAEIPAAVIVPPEPRKPVVADRSERYLKPIDNQLARAYWIHKCARPRFRSSRALRKSRPNTYRAHRREANNSARAPRRPARCLALAAKPDRAHSGSTQNGGNPCRELSTSR